MPTQNPTDLSVEWVDDWEVGSHLAEYGADAYDTEPETCEGCIVRNPSGVVLASLWCIDGATDEYRRQIETELLDEALAPICAALASDGVVLS